MMNFATPRLKCALLSQADKSDYCSLYTHDWVMEKIEPPHDHSRAELHFDKVVALNDVRPYRRLTWSIRNHDNSFCGIQGLIWHDPQKPEAEIGFMLNQQSANRRYSSEGMGALVDFGFTHLGLERIIGFFNPANIPVEKFVVKLGFHLHDGLTEMYGQSFRSIHLDYDDWSDHKAKNTLY